MSCCLDLQADFHVQWLKGAVVLSRLHELLGHRQNIDEHAGKRVLKGCKQSLSDEEYVHPTRS